MATNEDQPIIELFHVTKQFGKRPVVDDVTFDVAPGQVFGLIGPSGSGKTTLVKMMIGIEVPTEGEIRVFGVPPAKFPISTRERFGYMPQGFFLSPTLTAWENLSHIAALYGIGWFKKRRLIRQVLEQLGLWDARDKLAGDLSGGMMRRLQLGAVLIHNPELAFIDEPMEGLDPILHQEIWDILENMRQGGRTIVMTTHNMADAERCDTLALMSEGRLLATGKPADLRKRVYGGEIVRLVVDGFNSRAYDALRSIPGVKQIDTAGGKDIRLICENADSTLPRAIDTLHKLNIVLEKGEAYRPPFEVVFERLVHRD